MFTDGCSCLVPAAAVPKGLCSCPYTEQTQLVGAGWELEMNVRGCHPAPGPCPSCHKPLLLWLQLEQKGGWPFPGACRRGHTPWTDLMPQHHPGVAALAGCPHWPPQCPPPFAFPRKQKFFRGPTVICWRSRESWKSPSQDPRVAMPHSLSRCHPEASRKGRAWAHVSLGKWHGGARAPLSSDSEKQHPSPPSRAQDSQRGRGLRQPG